MYRFSRFIATAAIMSTLGCADRTKFHEMHDTTANMDRTTKSMDDKVGQTNEKMTGMDSKLGQTTTIMTGMDTKLGTTNTTMTGMDSKLGTTNQTMGEMNGTMKGMDNKLGQTNTTMTGMDKKIGGMALRTDEMSQKLSDMKAQMKELDAKTGNLFGLARNALVHVRQGTSRDLRDKELDSAQKATTIDGKISHAAAYYMAMEYQLTPDDNVDTEELREIITAQNMKEFLFKMTDFLPRDRSLPICELYGFRIPLIQEADNTMKTGYALAATLHIVNYNSLVLYKEKGKNVLSVLDMIEQALKSQKLVDEATDPKALAAVPKFVHEILSNREHATFLVQMRLNVLSSILVAKLSQLDSAGLPEWAKGWEQKRMSLPWSATIDVQNASRLKELAMVTHEALRAYNILVAAGEKPRLNFAVALAVKNMKLPAVQVAKDGKNIDKMRATLIGLARGLQAKVSSKDTTHACPTPTALMPMIAELYCAP